MNRTSNFKKVGDFSYSGTHTHSKSMRSFSLQGLVTSAFKRSQNHLFIKLLSGSHYARNYCHEFIKTSHMIDMWFRLIVRRCLSSFFLKPASLCSIHHRKEFMLRASVLDCWHFDEVVTHRILYLTISLTLTASLNFLKLRGDVRER